MKIQTLIVEDDKNIAAFIKRGIEEETFTVTLSRTGTDGLKQIENGDFDVVILDDRLPGKDGMTVLRELRESGNQIPVLMLSAKADISDIVAGLDAGADEYMAKPFALTELKARTKALVRRTRSSRGLEIRLADVRVDPVLHKVWRNDIEITLTTTEYSLFAYLLRNAGVIVSREDIARNCWENPIDIFSNIVEVYINHVRRKIDDPYPKKLIHTVRRHGYVLADNVHHLDRHPPKVDAPRKRA